MTLSRIFKAKWQSTQNFIEHNSFTYEVDFRYAEFYVGSGKQLPQTSALAHKCDIKHCITNSKHRHTAYRCKNERSVAFKIRQNAFRDGAVPRTPLGELTTLPETP